MTGFDFKKVFEAGKYDQYDPRLNHDAKHFAKPGTGFQKLADMAQQQMAKPGNKQTIEQIVTALAQQYRGEYGPAQTTVTNVMRLLQGNQKGLRHGDYSQVQESDELPPRWPTYSHYQDALKKRGWRSAGGDRSQYHDNAIAMRFFGPAGETLDVYIRDTGSINDGVALGWYLFKANDRSGRGTGFENLMTRLDQPTATTEAADVLTKHGSRWKIDVALGNGKSIAVGLRNSSNQIEVTSGPMKDNVYASVGRAREAVRDHYAQQNEDAHDMMPRKSKHLGAAAALDMKSAEEIMTPPEDADDSRRGVAEAHLWECGCDAMQGHDSSMAFAVDDIGNIMQIAKVDGREDDPDYQLDASWFGDSTQELIDRCSAGEEWIEVVNELAQRFAEFFDGSYQAHDFASDAFGRRAWEMGLWESQGMADEFDRTGNFQFPDRLRVVEMTYRRKLKVLECPTSKTLTKVFVVESRPVRYVTVGSKSVFESMPNRKTKMVARFWPV